MKSLMVVLSIASLFSIHALAAARCNILMERSAPGTQLTENEIRELVDKAKPYQDRRNKEWGERNKCLCCHTTLPFVLSRGLDSKSRASFEKFRNMAAEKVENPQADAWYEADHAGRNSKPTEAVLNAITLVMYDVSANTALQPTTLKSLDRIFENTDASGRLHWLDYQLEPFESKKAEVWGNSMAILAVELARKNSSYEPPAAKYAALKNATMQDTANLHPNEMAVLLWANSLNSGVLDVRQLGSYTQRLQVLQNADGSWNQKSIIGQGGTHADVYATSIAVIGLIKAGQRGPHLDKAVQWVSQKQQSGNILNMGDNTTLWQNTSMNRPNAQFNNRFATDFATSYASLALQMYRSEVLHSR